MQEPQRHGLCWRLTQLTGLEGRNAVPSSSTARGLLEQALKCQGAALRCSRAKAMARGCWEVCDCSVTQLLAATASQEAAFTCPCPGPAHRAAQEMRTAPRKQRVISFGSLLPDWRFPKCFVFTADGFWV